MATDELLKEGEAVEKDATEKVRNLQPPDMISNAMILKYTRRGLGGGQG